MLQRTDKGTSLCEGYLQGTTPQVRASFQYMPRKLRRRLLVLRCSTGNHLAEILGLLPEHHGSGNRSFTCIRFTNAGNIQRVSGQYCIHLVWLATEHREDQVFCHGIRAKTDAAITVGPQQCGVQQLRKSAPPKMLFLPLKEARNDVIYLASIGRKQTERRSDTAQMNEAYVLQFWERPPTIELEAQHAIVQGVSGVRIRSSCASHPPLNRTLRLHILHSAVVNDREPCP